MSWICFSNGNLCICCQWKPFEHEWRKRRWENATGKVHCGVCLCGDFFFWTEHQNHSITTRQLVLFASYLTQTCAQSCLYTPQHISALTTQSHKHSNQPSIFYARMHKTSACICKLQLMCVRGERWAQQEYTTRQDGKTKTNNDLRDWISEKERGQILFCDIGQSVFLASHSSLVRLLFHYSSS